MSSTVPGLYPVILSGGSGTRLWPLSRALYPKQLQSLTSERTMIQETALRLVGTAGLAGPLIVCNNDHRFAIADQMQQVGVAPLSILLEPVGRNTAPAVAAAALLIAEQAPDGVMAVLAADHFIGNPAAFRSAIGQARSLAQDGRLVTFGIRPDRPHTGYGYIEAGDPVSGDARAVTSFREKPDAETARQYIDTGRYFWNSGIFVFSARRFLEELEKWQPDILVACRQAVAKARRDLDFIRLEEAAFATSPSISIDYAVMEKTRDAAMIPVDMAWNDIGAWNALWEMGGKDANGNVLLGDVIALDLKNSYIRTERTLVAAIGLSDILIVETGDAVLVVPRSRADEVKEIVADLKRRGRPEEQSHPRHHRPWGYYETIDVGNHYQVKHLMVKPGGRLSLQMHHHRAEHWIVVHGTGRITRGDQVTLLGPNESTYIAIGMHHRLENPGKMPLHLIEVQSGAYLGEDDIVRLEDVYKRGPEETK
jgi:mannose-1-phosphate guanylyltransferase/mannose-6-phosphate isomerase